MAEIGVRSDIGKYLSFGDDLIGILRNNKDGENLARAVEGAKLLGSSYRADAHEARVALEEYQKNIKSCQEKIDTTRSETIGDSEIETLENEFEEKLQMERSLRQELSTSINDEFNDLVRQRISIEEGRKLVQKRENEMLRAENVLSMCASVTMMIPDLDDRTKISGFLVDRSKKKAEKFDIEPSLSLFDSSKRLWELMDRD